MARKYSDEYKKDAVQYLGMKKWRTINLDIYTHPNSFE